MRFRKIAGFAAAALTTGLVAAPLAAPAQAAPASLTTTAELECTFGDYKIAYDAELTASVDGANVTASMPNQFGPTGMPAFVTVTKFKVELDTTIDGEAVKLAGEESYSPAKPGTTPLAIPALSGTRTGSAAPEALAITGAKLTMDTFAFGQAGSNEIPCTVVVPPVALSAEQALECTFGEYKIDYAAKLGASVAGAAVTGTLSEGFTPGMPAFVTVSKMKVDVDTTIDGEAVKLSGESAFDPAKPGNTTFEMPALSGTRTATEAAAAIAITGATLTMTAMGADNVVPCVVKPTGPSAECVAAQTALTKADQAVKTAAANVTKATKTAKAATDKYKKATAKVKKANAQVKKAKSKAAKAKAKKALKKAKAAQKKAKAANTKAATALKAAKTKHTAAVKAQSTAKADVAKFC